MQMKKRMYAVLIGCACGMLLLIGRLVQIQLVSTESFSSRHINLLQNSVAQRTYTAILDEGRGSFVDRTGAALTGEERGVLILFPFIQYINWPVQAVAAIVQADPAELLRTAAARKQPLFYQKNGEPVALSESQMRQINALHIPGVIAVRVRVPTRPPAEHLIGLTGQNAAELARRHAGSYAAGQLPEHTSIGVSGLQRTFDELLLTDGETKLLYHVDRHGKPIFGKQVKYANPGNPFYPVRVQTTIDKQLQEQAEQLVDTHGLIKGGLVLLDIKTSDIIALVSRPAIQRETTAAYKQGAVNTMLEPQFPGSVFKVVTAAAAIEEDLAAGRLFNCSQNPYGDGPGERQLGSLSFQSSFAQSCNRAFAQLGEELQRQDDRTIEKYAERLGMSGTVGWEGKLFHMPKFQQLPEERPGIVWRSRTDRTDARAIDQTSIGQRNVQVSPLAVANMMATIARGGEQLQVRAVREIQYKTGARLHAFPVQHSRERISPDTAAELQRLLRLVVTNPAGTGAFYRNLPLAVAGKSGTAQTGKGTAVNHWFAGYFPYEAPRYALVVVDLETTATGDRMRRIFADYVKAIAGWEQNGHSLH